MVSYHKQLGPLASRLSRSLKVNESERSIGYLWLWRISYSFRDKRQFPYPLCWTPRWNFVTSRLAPKRNDGSKTDDGEVWRYIQLFRHNVPALDRRMNRRIEECHSEIALSLYIYIYIYTLAIQKTDLAHDDREAIWCKYNCRLKTSNIKAAVVEMIAVFASIVLTINNLNRASACWRRGIVLPFLSVWPSRCGITSKRIHISSDFFNLLVGASF